MTSRIARHLLCAILAALLIACSPDRGDDADREAKALAAQVHANLERVIEKLDEGRLNDVFVLVKDTEKLMADAGPEAAKAVPSRDMYLLNVYKANLYTSYRDFPQAAKAYSDAIRYAETAEDSLNRLLDISVISSHCGDSLAARRALADIARTVPDGSLPKEYALTVGNAYAEKFFGDKAASAALFRRSLDLAEGQYRLTPLSELYEYYASTGDIDSMNRYLPEYQRLAEEFRLPDMMADVKEGFLRAYIIQGDREKALQAYDEYFSIVDSLYNPSGFSALKSKYSDDEMERSNDRILSLQIAVSRQKAVISAIAALLAVAAAVWVLWRYARLSQRRIFFLNREIARQEAASSLLPSPSPGTDTGTDADAGGAGEEASTGGDGKRNGDLFRSIERALEDPSVYCDPDFGIQSLADLVGSNTKYVSQAINDIAGMNFRTYVNTLRVKVARPRLAGAAGYSNQTVQSIAESVGFRSASNFVIAFKKVMGITPSAYQKLVRQDSEEKRL